MVTHPRASIPAQRSARLQPAGRADHETGFEFRSTYEEAQCHRNSCVDRGGRRGCECHGRGERCRPTDVANAKPITVAAARATPVVRVRPLKPKVVFINVDVPEASTTPGTGGSTAATVAQRVVANTTPTTGTAPDVAPVAPTTMDLPPTTTTTHASGGTGAGESEHEDSEHEDSEHEDSEHEDSEHEDSEHEDSEDHDSEDD